MDNHDDNQLQEQQRLVVSVAIIATAVGLYSIDDNSHALIVVLQAFITLPSIILGLYVLFCAAHLKYKKSATIGEISIPEKLRRGAYDFGINMFWTLFLIGVLIFFASLLGWNGNASTIFEFWPSFIISFVVLLVLAAVMLIISEREKGIKRSFSMKWLRRYKK